MVWRQNMDNAMRRRGYGIVRNRPRADACSIHQECAKSSPPPQQKKQKQKQKQTKQTNKTNKQTDQQTKPPKWELLEAVDMSLAGNPGRRSSAPSWPSCATATYHRARQPADHVLVRHRYCCGRHTLLRLSGCGLLAAACNG